MEDFVKIVRVGTLPEYARGQQDYPADVFCKVELKGGNLSISGVVGPKSNGDAIGSCGQIVMGWTGKDKRYGVSQDEALEGYVPAPGWDLETFKRFIDVWDRWHLNDMVAGTPAQMAHLRDIASEFPGYPKSHYEWAKEELASVGLQPDPETGYSYGSAWLKEEVPEDVLAFLKSLPDADKQPAWV